MPRRDQDCLVILGISSRRLTATVAFMQADGPEEIVAHRAIHCRWSELYDQARVQAIADILDKARESANLASLHSVFVSISDPSLRANFAVGHTDLGQSMLLGVEDRNLAMLRATQQAIGTNRHILHVMQPLWTVRNDEGSKEVDDPVGHRGSHILCNVLLVTADRDIYDYLDGLLERLGIQLDGVIAPPIGLYRSLCRGLPKRGSTVIIDCGARHTSIMVHRKGRLIHLETQPFGGDDLTEAISESLHLPLDRAEALKHQLDLSMQPENENPQGQLYLWREIEENSRHLGPAAVVCASHVRKFFKDCCNRLKDNELLSHTGRVHVFGRAAALGGLVPLIREIFGMESLLGTKQSHRDPAQEIVSARTVGLVRAAADERSLHIALRRSSSGFRQVASAAGGLWSWLSTELV